MLHAVALFLFYLVTQLVLLVLCMHFAGKRFGIDFGPFWTAVAKAAVILLVVSGLMTVYRDAGFFVEVVVLAAAYYMGFILAFNLNHFEAAALALVYLVAFVLVHWVVIVLVLGIR